MYRYYATKRAPVSAWILDDPAPFFECSGLGGNAGIKSGSATPSKSVPLVAGAEYSSVFSSAAQGQFDCNLFKQGREEQPFALEAWVLPIHKTEGYDTQHTNLMQHPKANSLSQWVGTNATVSQTADGTGIRFVPTGTSSWGLAQDVTPIKGLATASRLAVSMDIRTNTGSARVQVACRRADDSTIGNASGGVPVPESTEWQRVTLYIPLPEGTDWASTFQVTSGGDTNLYVEFRRIVVEREDTDGRYFDGDSDGAYWSGAQNDSISHMLSSHSEQQILSHDGVFDGLSIDGKVIRFGTVYTNSGSAFCDYDLGEYKLAHVVGIHNKDQNQLWVNGELVSYVELTEEQKMDTYATGDGILYSGNTVSSQELAMNGVAFYPTISGDDIKRNYSAGIDFIGQDRVTPQLGGVTLDLSADANSIFIEEAWTVKFEFERGLKDNVEYAEDQIEPSYVDGVSVPGTWTVSIPLDAQNDPSIYGVMVAWSGHNVSVDVSLDGAAWTPAVSGRLVSIIPNGYNPSGKDLQIRVSFAGGLAEDPSFLESLSVVGYRDNTIQNITARPLSATHPAVVRRDFEPNLYRDDNGVRLGGGTLTIGPDTSPEPEVARTVELWIKPLSGTPTISVGGTRYRNGVADSTLPVGEWSLIHCVSATDITGNITVSGDAIIGQATLYPDALTASDVDFIWRSYTGRTALRFEETTTTVVSEEATPVVIYAHDWAIDSAG